MAHENIVSLIDVFEIDHDSFATVLELCEGEDLDMRLKRNGKLMEKEARQKLLLLYSCQTSNTPWHGCKSFHPEE